MGRQLSHWTKPPENTLKLNCDASFFPDERTGSWGALIWDSDGDLVLLGRGRINHLLDPFHAELIACLQGIQLAVNLGIGRIIVETGAQEVVKAVMSSSYDGSATSLLISEIKSLVDSNFLYFRVCSCW
jgi:ribonuclease HI